MTTPTPSNIREAAVTWTHDLVFTGGVSGGPTITIDGDGVTAPSPVVLLLLAAAACSGADVASILEKMRVGLRTFRVEATGTRREEYPRRYLAIHLVFRLSGTDLDQTKAERAIELSLTKYCSVVHSLAPDLVLTHALVLE